MTDRNDHYIPDGLSSGDGRIVEIGRGPWDGNSYGPPRLAIAKYGLADQWNREQRWPWARIDQYGHPEGVTEDGTLIEATEHWSRFDGHWVQVDVTLNTWNEREVNDWKGRDEIRKTGSWTLWLNRHQVWQGHFRDPFDALHEIPRVARKLIDHSMFNPEHGFAHLVGRPVFYERTPAIVTMWLDDGRVVLKPDGIDRFPPPVWQEEDDPYERETVNDTILAERIWWWRDPAPVGLGAPVEEDQPEADGC